MSNENGMTSKESRVISEAQRLAAERDESSLELLIGMQAKAIEKDPRLAEHISLEPQYDEPTMGLLDDVRGLGRRILKRWNRELNKLVCGTDSASEKDRNAILGALSLGETAVIGAVAAALLGLGVPAPIAAALAPLIVRRFIWPAKDELCAAWTESIKAEG
jgi:hypothetical protein